MKRIVFRGRDVDRPSSMCEENTLMFCNGTLQVGLKRAITSQFSVRIIVGVILYAIRKFPDCIHCSCL